MRYLSWASAHWNRDTLWQREGLKSATFMLVGSSDYPYSLYPNTSA